MSDGFIFSTWSFITQIFGEKRETLVWSPWCLLSWRPTMPKKLSRRRARTKCLSQYPSRNVATMRRKSPEGRRYDLLFHSLLKSYNPSLFFTKAESCTWILTEESNHTHQMQPESPSRSSCAGSPGNMHHYSLRDHPDLHTRPPGPHAPLYVFEV